MVGPSGSAKSYRMLALECRKHAAMTTISCNRAVLLSQAYGYQYFADIVESHAEDQSLHVDGLCDG